MWPQMQHKFRYIFFDMDTDITFRWIEGWNATPEEWERIEKILTARGWMVLNPNTSRILVAEQDEMLAGFVILQMVAHTEPLFVAPKFRGTELAAELSDRLIQFMHDCKARGWMAIASNSIVAAECERKGMKRVTLPVYAYVEDPNVRIN
jgi:hypothetical protein